MSAPRAQILLVDDEAFVRDALADLLTRRGYAVRVAGGVDEALEPDLLAGLDAVITDLRMPGKDGLELVRELTRREIRLPILVLTAYGTIGSAVECMRAGAADYLLKPTHGDELVLVLERALSGAQRERELAYLKAPRADAPAQARDPLGQSPAWQRVLELGRVAAGADTAVLLVGETGSGKEEVARYIHRHSGRSRQAFVAVNCAALPVELFESEFFGHRRGAFTGAVADRDGRFRIAHGGTLLLDEIDSLPASGSGQGAAGAAGRGFRTAGRKQADPGRRAADLRHQQRPLGQGGGRALPVGPFLPHQRADPRPAAAAQPGRATSGCWPRPS